MQHSTQTINCTLDGRPRPFILQSFTIEPTGDDEQLVKEVLSTLAGHGAVILDPSGKPRNPNKLVKTRYLGVLSEVLLQRHLQSKFGTTIQVHNLPFTDYATHVDLEVEGNGRKLSIEVRGSFPYSALSHVICNIFDIIGPYETRYKPQEVVKDFYLRTLINQDVNLFDIYQPHTLYFCGGAEKALLDKVGYWTNFDQQGARYRAIKPIAKARDAEEIIVAIKESL